MAKETAERARGETAMQHDTQETDKGVPQASLPFPSGFAVWGLLWLGGTLFIKKDGNGCRM